MSDDAISVPYNRELKALEGLLSGVRRPGDFFVLGALETPIPRVEVEGVGVISFPIPEAQIQQLIQQATRAPYGRGEETIQDQSVRKTWQVPASQVRLGGKTWEKTFAQMLATVVEGLGCTEAEVSAELYKLLVYDPGGFFKAHRDTEKAGGMFGTMVLALPSAHRGGELVIRHAGREVVADLSTEEFSELRFAAFYADCEHEVRPVTEGHRVCLIYNLTQTGVAKSGQPLRAPLYASEIEAAAAMLQAAFAAAGAPAKLAWLLDHQYSPAGLSFAGLKGEDAALAKVLRAAAEQAGCAIHLGIVHIEESGPAEPRYDADYGYGRRRRWRTFDDEETEEDTSSDSFEVIEVSESSRHIDQWMSPQDQPVAYGQLPLEDGEILPAGALDGEDPDEQRLMEATGNEGASFERSYHRAALVIWPRERFAAVLIQAGVGAALPHLAERLAAGDKAAASIAERIIEAWERPSAPWSYGRAGKEPDRTEMLGLLGKLGDQTLLKRFIGGVATRDYDGSENEALAASALLLGPELAAQLLTGLARSNMALFHRSCVHLLRCLIRELGEQLTAEWEAALREVASVVVDALPRLAPAAEPYASPHWQRARKAKPVDAAMVAELLDGLGSLRAPAQRAQAVAAIVRNEKMFDPAAIVVPALTILQQHARKDFPGDIDCGRLWVHAAEFLLRRSERPPAPPADWRQDVKLSCKCEDCRALQVFLHDAASQVARFRAQQHRRSHLESQILTHRLDIACDTERRGSPHTLVCTKTRGAFQRQCKQHRADCGSMSALLDAMRPVPDALAELARRLAAARELKPQT